MRPHVSTLAPIAAAIVFTASVGVRADQQCWRAPEGPTALMTCRGSASMGGSSFGDADLVLRFRPAGEDAVVRARDLAPARCTWSTRPMTASEPRVLVFPAADRHGAEPFPIANQARVCATNAACVMSFCAYVTDRDVRAVDGFINLSFW
jgi:hypothetical protein